MKAISSCFIILLFACYAGSKEKIYTASTPADSLVKMFLGIPLTDSVDYIRWKIILRDYDYSLDCNYITTNKKGIVTQNRKVELKGKLSLDKNYYTLYNDNKILKLAELNTSLLHILHPDNSLLIGNGGWSYTINAVNPSINKNISLKARPTVIKDSMIFVGRTPCRVPGIPQSSECNKLKWKIVFYGNSDKNEPTTFKVYGTPYRKEGFKPGTWKIVTSNGRIFYYLYDKSGKPYLYLEKADENILLFADASGKLLTGDEDFSYTLNRDI